MALGPNGLIGGIRSTFLRRLAVIFVAVPVMVLGMTPTVLWVLPSALGDAWDAFADFYSRPVQLFTAAIKQSWSKDWKPSE
ncbi:hypothetical protein MARCHEWKA_05330 [Brevundimonas phage vB_BpoS-Marchewka]|uniref:Uncharacterized protein n=1 Tax=Brevundimonas phage vB_BpoS-Marchewka TaxID=2948604 RepID=A0A9E7N5R1_9CAUD|nr:hypothetical protein MARCHEWKA_05330 [Brevundimonas phage vB_BpoS-Marchewka]UTC29482.1 hypothetical protein BAMBUS_04030 [Brevundimonas phage vB_BpoS-Bambus]